MKPQTAVLASLFLIAVVGIGGLLIVPTCACGEDVVLAQQGPSRGAISVPRDPEQEKQSYKSLDAAKFYFYKRKPNKGDKDSVERITDEVQGAAPLIEEVLDGLTNSPLVATIASRFVGRVVNDVIATNRAMAEKIPGMGPLVSMGAWSAGMMRGAADRSLDQMLGDTAAKGAVFVMRRLNKIIVETLKDKTTRAAVLEIFDLYADKPVVRLDRVTSRDDVHRIADLIQDIVIAGAPAGPVLAIAEALIDGFFKIYGDEPVTTLLTDLDLERELIVEHATSLVGGVLTGAMESGELEKLLRARLGEFYASPKVAAILG